MAKRVKDVSENPKYKCKDCVHSYDWHSKALDGHLILCRCKEEPIMVSGASSFQILSVLNSNSGNNGKEKVHRL